MPTLDPTIAQKIAELREQAERLMGQGEYEKAGQTYMKALEALPDRAAHRELSAQLCFDYGRAYFMAKQWKLALHGFRMAVGHPSFEKNPELHLYIGMAYHHKGERKEAMRVLNWAHHLGGDDVFKNVHPKFLEIAKQAYGAQSPTRAGQSTLAPEIESKVNQLRREADELMAKRQYKKAAETYIAAFRLLPKPTDQWEELTPQLCFEWGRAFFMDKQWEVSLNSFDSALRYRSFAEKAELHLYMGMAYHHLRKHMKARQALNYAHFLGGDDAFKGVDPIFLEIATKPYAHEKAKKKKSDQKKKKAHS